MLGIIIRGIFICSILYWYSTTIWKMIDGYFRDQFKSYLEEEYKKNPKMKSDVRVEDNKKNSASIIVESPRDSLNLSNSSTITNEMNETDVGNKISESSKGDEILKEPSESDKKFLDTASESELKTNGKEDENREATDNYVKAIDDKSNDIPLKTEELDSLKSNRMKFRNNKVNKDSKEIFNKNRVSKKKETVRLNEKSHVSNDYDDFWEFEEDADEKKESREGILISELPFKPKLDLGDLERVNKDEYCPLSLEDEEPCEKLYKWP
ncbi:uncharacterized protein LOC108629571 [Ceratina calcarata]|uniref:Uncharacterized protein LOC108629571 n=1 Tax=Ceratina calcarata TaxID=156304 RepID=A0AAJ7JA59_9HYME|nr:uncharacterized protein LOC108629571 [Ceratina calcarata]